MIYSIVGTNKVIKDKALAELKRHGEVSRYIYSEHIGDLEQLIDGADLFGGTTVVSLVSLLDNASTRDRVLDLLPRMKESPNIFIIDEPFLDAAKTTKLSKVSEKLYDAREEKRKDSSVFVLCLSVAKRDKKSAWLTYQKIKEHEEGEKIAGALWWKWKEVWEESLATGKGPYTKEECERIGGQLLRASLDAHRGKAEIEELLERIILSI